MSEEEQLVGTLIKIESHKQVEFIPNEYSRHVIDSEGLPVYAEPQPQLTIPKSAAESKWMKHLLSCDLSQFEFERFDEFLNKEDEQFLKWVNTDKNENILYIYLAGKALGVDLVKVVADD